MAAVTKALGIITTDLGDFTALVKLKNFKTSVTAEKHQTTDELGNVLPDDDVYYQEKHTVTADGTQLLTYARPTIGSVLTVGLIEFKIDEFEETETNEDKPQFSVTCTRDIASV